MELVDSISEVMINAKEFNGIDVNIDTVPLKRFSQFFHWYYFSSLDVFAPSKFIGYKNTNIDNYRVGSSPLLTLLSWLQGQRISNVYKVA